MEITEATLPKLCHNCGAEVESERLWLYQRGGVYQPLLARCEVCALRERIQNTYAALSETYRQLAEQQKRLLDLLEGRVERGR